jgi:hypothetical protein
MPVSSPIIIEIQIIILPNRELKIPPTVFFCEMQLEKVIIHVGIPLHNVHTVICSCPTGKRPGDHGD